MCLLFDTHTHGHIDKLPQMASLLLLSHIFLGIFRHFCVRFIGVIFYAILSMSTNRLFYKMLQTVWQLSCVST